MPAKGGSASGGKIKRKFAVLAALILAFFFAGSARADYWTRYNSTNSDLPANSWVSDITKDSRGAKWIYGNANNSNFLYTFDGSNWDDFSSNMFDYGGAYWSIQDMYANDVGEVWFVMNNLSLVKYDGGSWTSYFYNNSSATSLAEQLYPGQTVSNPCIYFYSVFGNPASSSVYSVIFISGMVDGENISSNFKLVKRDSSGNWSIAVTNESGSPITSGNSFALFGSVNPVNGDVWFSLSNSSGAGIYRYNGSWTRYTTSNGLISNSVSDSYIDASGNVWLATDRGVSKFDGTSWVSWTTDNSELATNIVTSVEGDADGKIWFVSTYNSDTTPPVEGGTSVYNPADGTWIYYSIRNSDDTFSYAYSVWVLDDEMWATVSTGTGVLALTKNDDYTTIYGQVNGQTVEKAVYSELKKKNKTKSRKVNIWKVSRVQKKNKKWKTVRRKVYHTKTSDWYKVINLETGTYLIKVQGKRSRTVTISSGDPYRLNF
ncbi:MAG: hypothetical protein A3J76_05500 [Candidatus Moranbacteria bacterium RBG_13_45_13]|nr:MAG: hypothetical protein A3J76_05500 [Candidatus Moranbacteria bacterium RBG_13_45_13]